MRKFHYIITCLLLIALLMLYPFLERQRLGEVVLDSLSTALLFTMLNKFHRRSQPRALAKAIENSPPWPRLALIRGRIISVLSLCVVVFIWSDSYLSGWQLPATGHGIITGLFVIATGAVVCDLFNRSDVSFNHLAGCATAYLLLGFTFSSLYFVIIHLSPGAITVNDVPVSDYSKVLFFSFESMTTMGYSDTFPVGRLVRSLANLEAMTGQLFLSIFVGQVVGMYISGRTVRSGSVD